MNCIYPLLYTLITIISLPITLFAQQKPIEVSYEKTTEGYRFYGTNNTVVPYYLKFKFSDLKNLKSNEEIASYTPVLHAKSSHQALLFLETIEQNKNSEFNFNYIYTIGEPSKSIDTNFAYLLPYKHGKRYRVAQGNNGDGTHKGINAIDFNLNIGDSVYAARDGVVFEVKEDSNIGGNNLSFENKGNYINIYHQDGTIAKYVHLQQNGALVETGDTVAAGDLIGISGNTGYSSGPHLHFALVHNESFQSKTLVAQFLNYKNQLFVPKEGQSYYSYHPGGPTFEVKDNESFKEEEFEASTSKSDLNNTIEIESEAYGDYTLLYVNNGFNALVNGTLKLTLNNMEATKSIPHSFSVNSNTKKYLLAIKPKKASEKYGYQVSAEFRK